MLAKATLINNEYRTSAMNRKYYACRLQETKRVNLAFEIIVAISTSGAIAAWSIWQTGTGAAAWKFLAAIAALVSVVKPFLGFDKDIERYSELVVGYAALFYDIRRLLNDIKTANQLTPEDWNRFGVVQQRMAALGVKDDLKPRRKLHTRCYRDVIQEIPHKELWWPAGGNP